MDRRNFLKQASGYALAAAGTMTGIGQVFATTMPAKENRIDLMGHRADPFTESQIDK